MTTLNTDDIKLVRKAAELVMDVEARGELRSLADRMQQCYQEAVDKTVRDAKLWPD